MNVRLLMATICAIAMLVAFGIGLYFTHNADHVAKQTQPGNTQAIQLNDLWTGTAFASAVCLWMACLTCSLTIATPARKKALLWFGLVQPVACAVVYLVLLIL